MSERPDALPEIDQGLRASTTHSDSRRNVRAVVAYDGSGYHGWQFQPSLLTIQGEIERALYAVTGGAVRVHGAGRTDAGVHALGQVASFEVDTRLPDPRLLSALNSHLPSAVRISVLETAPPEFHARFSAHWREYGYLLVKEESPFLSRYSFRPRPWPDLDLMNSACEDIAGERDYRAFTSQAEGPFGCHLLEAGWRACPGGLVFQVRSDRFLYRMVRFLAGACIEIGRGNRSIGHVRELLGTGDRSRVPAPAPAMGVYLLRVGYGPEWRRDAHPQVAGPLPFVIS